MTLSPANSRESGGSALVGADGWIDDTAAVWTRTADQTFTVTGDRTAVFQKGTRLKWTQTTVKYGVVSAVAFAAGTTTVTIATTADYVLTAAAISANYYSYAVSPQGYPTWFAWAPTYTGFSVAPSGGTSRFKIDGPVCTLEHYRDDGTSNAVTFKATLPVNATVGEVAWGRIKNNGADVAASGMVIMFDPDATSLAVYLGGTAVAFAAANAKNAKFTIAYAI